MVAIQSRTASRVNSLKMVQAMIDCVGHSPAPRRLLLGSGAYAQVRAALVDRLAALDAQREVALSTDVDE